MAVRVLHTNFHLGWGGQAARVFLVCKSLVEMGLDVTVAAPKHSVLVQKCKEAGIPTFDNVRFSKGFRPIDFLRDVRSLRGFLASQKVDILHTHGAQDTWSGCVAASLCKGRPRIVRTRHNTFPVRYSLLNRFLYRRLIDRLILVSDSVMQQYTRFIEGGILSPKQIATVHSCIQVERFDPSRTDAISARADLGVQSDVPVVAVAARLAREKGHVFLLQALASVKAGLPNIVLLVAGEGNQERSLRAYADQLGLSDNVQFLGFLDDVPKLFAACDVAVLPSIDCDASSASIKEAMAMERPVIATSIGGAAEIIDDGVDGIIVPPKAPDALAEALISLLTDPERRRAMGQAGRAKVKHRFTEKRLAEETVAVYEQLLTSKPGIRRKSDPPYGAIDNG